MKLILITQDGCAPCQSVKNFLNDEDVEFDTINVSLKENESKIKELNVSSTPITILQDEDGEEVSRIYGFNISQLEVFISQL